jgi:hypothetical protein
MSDLINICLHQVKSFLEESSVDEIMRLDPCLPRCDGIEGETGKRKEIYYMRRVNDDGL